ncbi:hypothetical protein UF75_0053 [Desulfosporosinus sp. I2]|nr:hypothetical protein UF75_0053 [Desulfosporosinus sp. I2]
MLKQAVRKIKTGELSERCRKILRGIANSNELRYFTKNRPPSSLSYYIIKIDLKKCVN